MGGGGGGDIVHARLLSLGRCGRGLAPGLGDLGGLHRLAAGVVPGIAFV